MVSDDDDVVLSEIFTDKQARVLARQAVNTLRRFDPVAYHRYSKIKYPPGGADTVSKQAAYDFALKALAAMALRAAGVYSQELHEQIREENKIITDAQKVRTAEIAAWRINNALDQGRSIEEI